MDIKNLIKELANLNKLGLIYIVLIILAIATISGIIAFQFFKKSSGSPVNNKGKKNFFSRIPWLKPVLIILILSLLYLLQPFLSLSKTSAVYYSNFLTLSLISFLTWLAISALDTVRNYIIKIINRRYIDKASIRSLHTKLNILFKIAAFTIGVIGTALALMTFPKIQRLGISILASAGLLGVIVGLAAQKSLGNILAGIQIAIAQPIRIGDLVIVEGEFGTIEQITLTYVVLRAWDLRRLVIPITYFIDKTFQNWTRSSHNLIGTIFLHVDYQASIDVLRTALDIILEKNQLWDKNVKSLQVTDTSANSIELRILVSSANADSLWNLRCCVREELISYLQKNHPEYLPKTRIEIKDNAAAKLSS